MIRFISLLLYYKVNSENRLKKLLRKWEQENKLILINTHDYRLISESFEKFEVRDKNIKEFSFKN